MSHALATLLLSTLAAAPAPAPAAPPSVVRLAQLVTEDVRAFKPEPPVAVHLSGASPELRRAVGTLLAAQLAALELGPVILEAPSAEAAETLAREQGARSLVRLTLSVSGGELRASGDALGTWVNFWAGRTPSRPPAPAAAVVRAVEADAGALALAAVQPQQLMSSSPLPSTSGGRAVRLMGAALLRLDSPPTGLAAGDLDGDGKDEVAVLTERAVSVFGGDGQLLARREMEGLPLNPTPPREPFGMVAIVPQPARLAAWSTRYSHGEVLLFDRAKGTLRSLGQLDTAPIGAFERATFTPGQTNFAAEVRLGEGRLLAAPAPFTSASIVPPRMLFVHPDGSGSLYPRPTTAPVRIQGLGAGSALGDLDGDGTPELITTAPQLFPSPEVVRVYALSGDDPTTHSPLWQSTLATGRALHVTTADLDQDKQREVLVGVWHSDGTGEVLLMRQGAP